MLAIKRNTHVVYTYFLSYTLHSTKCFIQAQIKVMHLMACKFILHALKGQHDLLKIYLKNHKQQLCKFY